jgi:hypothetical protein
MSIRKNLIMFLGILLFFCGFAHAQNYGQTNKVASPKERRYYGTVVEFKETIIVISRQVTQRIRERLNFKIDSNTEITGNISKGSKVAVIYRILNRNHHRKLALKIYPVERIPK